MKPESPDEHEQRLTHPEMPLRSGQTLDESAGHVRLDHDPPVGRHVTDDPCDTIQAGDLVAIERLARCRMRWSYAAYRAPAWRQSSAAARATPSPVRAEMVAAAGCRVVSRLRSSLVTRSTLLNTSMVGTFAAPTSSSTRPTAADLSVSLGARRVDHVKRQIGLRHFLERRTKRGHQRVRQSIDETHCVGNQKLTTIGQTNPPHKRIEGHKQSVRRRRLLLCQPVEQRRLAGVGVADERHGRYGLFVATLAQLMTTLPHLVDFALNRLNARPDAPAVCLELRLTGTARPDASAETRECGASHQRDGAAGT